MSRRPSPAAHGAALLALLAGSFVASPPAAAQTAPAPAWIAGLEPLGQATLPVWPDVDENGDSWREDPDRLRRKWELMPSPEDYRRALRATGMADELAARGRALRGGSGWQPVGPIGAFGASERNGRISNVQVLSDGGSAFSIYAGACQGGLWKSTSAGQSWTDLTANLPHYACRAFDVRPSNRNDIVIATGEIQRSKGGGVFRTTDGGGSWLDASLPGSTPESCYRIGRKTNDESVLLLASNEGLLRSTNGGTSWSYAQLSTGGATTGHWTDLVLHPTQANVMYSARWNTGPFRSTDGGATWTSLAAGLPSGTEWDRASLALCETAPSILVAAVENTTEAVTGIYRSTDSGTSWTNVTNGLTGAQAFHTLALAIDPNDSDVIYLGLADLYRSTDAGGSWQGSTGHPIEKGHSDITRLLFSAAAGYDFLWICNDGGIYAHYLTLDATIPLHGTPPTGLQCSEMDFHDADRTMRTAGLQDNGILRTTDVGQNWEALATGDGADTEISDPESGELWYSTGVFPGNPAWRVFRQPATGDPVYTSNPDNYQPRLVHDRWANRVYMCSGEALWSTPASGTANWTSQLSGFQTSPYSVRTIEGTPVDGSTIWVTYWDATDNGRDLTVLKKVSGNWTVAQHHEALNPSQGTILSVAASPDWPDVCWVAMQGTSGQPKILRTTDGVTFDDWTGNLASAPAVWCVAVPPFRPREAYAGTDFGIFRTTDAGATWEPFQTGLPAARCRALSWVVDDTMQGQDRLVVATDGRGMWERVIDSPPVLYADARATGFQDGTWEHPFDTVGEAIATAPAGSIVAIRGDTYAEPQVVAGGDVTLVPYFAKAVID